MLHILWMILKFILIVIGILLGLVVLALLLLLFCPVCYRVQAAGSMKEWKKAHGSASVSWLFGGIRFTVCLRDGNPKQEIRILGISLEKLRHLRKTSQTAEKGGADKKQKASSKKKAPATVLSEGKKQKKPDKVTEAQNKEKEPSPMMQPKDAEDLAVPQSKDAEDLAVPQSKDEEDLPVSYRKDSEKTSVQHQKDREIPHVSSNKERKTSSVSCGKDEVNIPLAFQDDREDSTASQVKLRKKTGIFQKFRNKIFGILDRLKRIPEFIRNFQKNIQKAYAQLDYWKQFFAQTEVKEAAVFAWQRIRRLLKHLLPVKIRGQVTFGCEDPSVTGTVLAILGITIPFHKNCLEVHPLFDGENSLEGEVKLCGRIYGIVLIITAVQIYFNKNIKYVISRWKHKEESL